MWKAIMLALQMKSERITGDANAKVDDEHRKMSKLETYIGVQVCGTIFGPCEHNAKGLQSDRTTATALQSAGLLVARLQRLGSDDEFFKNYTYNLEDMESLQLALPQERRTAKLPLRHETTANCFETHVFTPIEKMRHEYVATLDLLIAEVERPFNQPGIKLTANIEQLLFAAISTQGDTS
jgi:hypothetical protein